MNNTIPFDIRSSIRYVLTKLKAAGQTPLPWRLMPVKYRGLNRVELIPSSYGFTSVLAMLEYMAELGECQLSFLPGLGACVEIKEKKFSEKGDIDLSMLDLPWADTGELPVGAVDGEGLDQQEVLGVREGADLPVQVTEVVSLDTDWFCLEPVKRRDNVMDELNSFYTKGEGRRWIVPTSDHCWAGRLMAALYKTEGFHRIMVKRVLEGNMIKVLYVDFGTVDKIRLKDILLLHKFLKLPAQAIEARLRLWGVKEVEVNEAQARARLVELVREGNLCGGVIGVVMAGVKVGRSRRRDWAVEVGGRLALWLIDLGGDNPEGGWINKQLVDEGIAEWDILDLITVMRKNRGESFKKIKAKLSRMLISNKKMAVKGMQSVQSNLQALVENFLSREELVSSHDMKDEDQDGSFEDKIVKDADEDGKQQLNSYEAVTKIITLEDSSDDEDTVTVLPFSQHCTPPTLQQRRPPPSQLYWGSPPVAASKAVRLTYSDYGGAVVDTVDTVDVNSNDMVLGGRLSLWPSMMLRWKILKMITSSSP